MLPMALFLLADSLCPGATGQITFSTISVSILRVHYVTILVAKANTDNSLSTTQVPLSGDHSVGPVEGGMYQNMSMCTERYAWTCLYTRRYM